MFKEDNYDVHYMSRTTGYGLTRTVKINNNYHVLDYNLAHLDDMSV